MKNTQPWSNHKLMNRKLSWVVFVRSSVDFGSMIWTSKVDDLIEYQTWPSWEYCKKKIPMSGWWNRKLSTSLQLVSLVDVLVLRVRADFLHWSRCGSFCLAPFFNSSVCATERCLIASADVSQWLISYAGTDRHAGDAVKADAVSKLRKWLGVALKWRETPIFGRPIQNKGPYGIYNLLWYTFIYIDCICLFQGRICAIAPVPLPHLVIEHCMS